MMEKVQRFGGAMFTPVLLFSFSGLMVSLAIIFKNPMLVGSIATEGTTWYSVWSILEDGAWTVFNQMELLFVIGLPIGLAKKANARAVMEAFVVYLTFQYFVSGMLKYFGPFFGVDFFQEVGGESGMKLIAGIQTLDTGIVGAIVISAIVVFIHNRFFDTKLPDFLGIFQGSSLVVIIGFFTMVPMAFLVCLIWPKIQFGISSMQGFLATSGVLGVWIYTFLERILIPTGLHHFIYSPFVFGPAVVPEGITKAWMANLNSFSASTTPVKQLFPEGGFALHGNSKMFGSLGIAAALYFTARPENKKRVLSILIPITLTAFLAGITEPLEFTFLFISPPLFLIHALLAASMSATMFAFGVVGDMGSGFLDLLAKNWIPLFANHKGMIFTQLMGPGLAIELASDEIYAPIEGRVTSVFPTKHAISLETKDKKAILLHMGLDTVELNGAGFEIFVKENDLVTPNTRLAKIDRAFLKEQGKDDLLVILFPEEKTIPDYPLGQTEKQAPLFDL